MISATYTRLEIVRTFRNRRFFILTLGFPLVLYFLVAGTNRNVRLDGIAFPVYYMIGMASWGVMAAAMAGGARIALERSVGWTRQMRITPLPVSTYFRTKVVTSYFMAIVSLVLLYAAGLTLGVHLHATAWLQMTGLILVGLVPFVVLGILLGHVLSVDSMGPALGGIVAIFSLLGGAFGPIAKTGALKSLVELLPSYWLVQGGRLAVGADAWPAKAWLVVAVWTVILLRLTVRVYHRDTGRA